MDPKREEEIRREQDEKERMEILRNVDVDGFIRVMKREGCPVPPTPRQSEIAIHKARCELAGRFQLPRELGVESGEWLAQRGLFQGVRWWLT